MRKALATVALNAICFVSTWGGEYLVTKGEYSSCDLCPGERTTNMLLSSFDEPAWIEVVFP